MVILGVDPGSLRTGYGAIDTDGRRHQLIETGFIGPSRLLSLPERLRLIHAGLSDLIARGITIPGTYFDPSKPL